MNITNINPGLFPIKAIAVPLVPSSIRLNGTLRGKAWQQAERFRDFTTFPDRRNPVSATEVRIFRDRENLYIGGSCFQAQRPEMKSGDGFPALSGDGIEIVLGTLEPEMDMMMFGVSAAGGRFGSCTDVDVWSVACAVTANGWTFEMKIPFTLFREFSYKLCFNIFRRDAAAAEFQAWNRISFSTFELEHGGELLLCDYASAAFFKTGRLPELPFERAQYEQLLAVTAVPAGKLLYTPYLTVSATGHMDVVFFTAGESGGAVEYRAAGTENWNRTNDAVAGAFEQARFHRLSLAGLEPGLTHEYRIVTWNALHGPEWRSEIFRFEMPAASRQKISFGVLADCHGARGNVSGLLALPAMRAAELWCDLGDSVLQYATGKFTFMESAIATYAQAAGGGRPIVGVRGNHDQHGRRGSDFIQLLGTAGGRSYGSFRWGPVLFILLDNGADVCRDHCETEENRRLRNEERRWLFALRRSSEFREAEFRVALTHMTPYDDQYGSREFLRMTTGVFGDSEADRLHALIGGHLHFYYAQLPHRRSFELDREWSSDRTSSVKLTIPPVALPYFTICIPGGCGVENESAKSAALTVAMESGGLRFRLWNAGGTCIHCFLVRPDGTAFEEFGNQN